MWVGLQPGLPAIGAPGYFKASLLDARRNGSTETKSSEFTIPRRDAYIADRNLHGWTWLVRAQDSNSQWGWWSETREFDVAPVSR
jgi:hypothetical protein